MFKRVAKRQRKAETKERTLEDQPEYSESGSELDEDAASSSSHSDSDDSSSGSDSDEDQEQAAALPAGTLTVKDAFEDPIFSSVLDESVQSCAFCTGVLLKNEHMVKTHLSAKSHTRRVNRLKIFVQSNPELNEDDIDEALQQMDTASTTIIPSPQKPTEGLSKRAQKKAMYIQRKRDAAAKGRAAHKEKKAAPSDSATSTKTPQIDAVDAVDKDETKESTKKKKKQQAPPNSDVSIEGDQANDADKDVSKEPKKKKRKQEPI